MSSKATASQPRPTSGDLAERLAYWSVLPLFPIGVVAAVTGMYTLARGGNRRQGWTGIVLGIFFAAVWFVVMLWLLLRHIESPG